MAEERIDIVVSQRGATEVRRDLDSIAQSARAAVPNLDGMRSAVERISAAAAATAGPVSQLRNAMASLGPSMTGAAAGLRTLGPVSQVTITQFGTLQGAAAGLNQNMQRLGPAITGTATATMGMARAAGGAVPPVNNLAQGLGNAGGAAANSTPAVNGVTSSFYSLWRVLLALAIIRQVTSAISDSIDSWTMMSNKLRQVSTDAQNLVASQEAVYRSAQLTRSGMEEIATLYSRTAQASAALGLSQKEVMEVTETVAMAMKLNGGSLQESSSAMRQLSQAFNKGKLDGDEFKSIMENAPALQKAFAQSLGVSTGELMRMSRQGELTLPKLIAALQQAGPSIRAAFGSSLPLISEGFTYLGNAVTRFFGQLNEATGFSLGFYNVMKLLGDNLGILGVVLAAVGAAVVVAFGPAALSMVVTFGVAVATALGPVGLIAAAIAGVAAAVYTWGDAWKVTSDGITVLDYLRAALQVIGEYAGVVGRYLASAFGDAWNWVKETWGTATAFFGTNLSSVGQMMQTAVGYYYGFWIGLVQAMIEAWGALPGALIAIMQTAMNGVVQVTQDALNAISGAINGLLEKVGIPVIPKVDLSGFKSDVDAAALNVGGRITGAFTDGLNQGKALVEGVTSGLGAAADQLTAKAREINRTRLAMGGQPGLSTTKGPNTFSPDDGAAVEKLQKKLDALLRTIDPITGAQEKLRQGTETLDKAYAAGLITLERRDELQERLAEHLRDQLDPIGAINREMAKEAQLLRLGNGEREVQRKLLDDIEKLRRSGVTPTEADRAQLEQSIRALNALKEQSKLLGDVLDRVFKGAEDAFVEFVTTGKVNFSSLIKSMIADLARLAFQKFITNSFMNLLGGLLGGGLGGGATTASSSISGVSGYATGTSFMVGGNGGVDSQLVAFRASPNERVTVERNGGSASGGSGGSGGGSDRRVIVHNYGAEVTQEPADDGSDDLILKVRATVRQELGSGRSNSVMQRTFGVSPRIKSR